MKLIDKDALVAEVEKCYNECLKRAKITDSDYWNAKADAYRNVLTILNDSLEVSNVERTVKDWKEEPFKENRMSYDIGFYSGYKKCKEDYKAKECACKPIDDSDISCNADDILPGNK